MHHLLTAAILNSFDEENGMNENQAKGAVEEAKGKVKEAVGKAVGDKKMENKGKVEKLKGKVQTAFGNARAKIKKAI